MNNLVDNVNSKIKAVCEANSQCVFVDPTDSINTLMGHFCEPGVDESYRWPGGGVSANRSVISKHLVAKLLLIFCKGRDMGLRMVTSPFQGVAGFRL